LRNQGERAGWPVCSGAVVAEEVHTFVGGIRVGNVGYVVKGASGQSMFFESLVKVRETYRAGDGSVVYLCLEVGQDFEGGWEARVISEVDCL